MDNKQKPIHQPIMVEEIIKYLNIIDNGTYLDVTTGEGGHSEKLLEHNSTINLICADRDKTILEYAETRLNKYQQRIRFIVSNFDKLHKKVEQSTINGIIADLGISSYHFDADSRGFSFSKDNNLDMRLDGSCEYSAYDIINDFSEKDIADIIYKFGEERFSRRIAKNIIEKRAVKKIQTTKEFKEIIYNSIPKKFHPKNIHPATKTFQALRIYINDELTHIKEGIENLIKLLKPGGRICVLSFHSLEDRIIKNKFRELSGYRGNRDPYSTDEEEIKKVLKIITKKPLIPSKKEIEANPRSRSTKLRVAEKL